MRNKRNIRKENKRESDKHVLLRVLEDYIFRLARSTTGPAPLSRMSGWGGEEGHFYIVSLDQLEAQPTDYRSYIMQVSPHYSRALIIYSIPAQK